MTDKTLLDGFGEATEQVVALRAEVERLRADAATWGHMWDDLDLLEFRVEALRNGTAILGSHKAE